MPYTIKKNNKGRYCVYKKGADGSAVGKSLGCHDTKRKASKQIGAIESSEKGKAMEDILESPTESTSNATNIKEVSLDQMRNEVSSAFDDTQSFDLWIVEIFDAFVIARDSKEKTHWKIPYTRSGSDVSFEPKNQWLEVKLNKDWVQKAWSIKDRFDFEDYEGDDIINPIQNTIKELGGNRLGFYGMLWGDKSNKDLHGEYFTKKTDGLTELFDQLGTLPFTYHHAIDPNIKSFVFGHLDTMSADDIGMWCEVQITKHKQYKKFIKPLVNEEALYPSSETLVGAKQVATDGEIKRWVTSFMTGTSSPAEWRMLEKPVSEIKGYYQDIGVNFPEIGEGDDNNSDKDTQENVTTTKGVEKAQSLELLIEIELQKNKLLQLQV
jgi:hypothetical protein